MITWWLVGHLRRQVSMSHIVHADFMRVEHRTTAQSNKLQHDKQIKSRESGETKSAQRLLRPPMDEVGGHRY